LSGPAQEQVQVQVQVQVQGITGEAGGAVEIPPGLLGSVEPGQQGTAHGGHVRVAVQGPGGAEGVYDRQAICRRGSIDSATWSVSAVGTWDIPRAAVAEHAGMTLIVANSYSNRLTAFDIEADGGLSNRRVWAETGEDHPDGICIDAEGAVWYADVGNKHCVRVREGGEVLQTVDVDRGCFACMLGGQDGKTLFIVAAEWRMPEMVPPGTGRLLSTQVTVPGAGWP
jgi:hypothetical protein